MRKKRLLEIAAEIVEKQASRSRLGVEDVERSLISTFNTLMRIKEAEEQGELLDARVEPSSEVALPNGQEISAEDSIQEDYVICLECQAKFRQLTAKHLASHGLTVADYKKKWGFRRKDSLSAASLSKSRSQMAKKRGLPAKLKEYQAKRKRRKETKS